MRFNMRFCTKKRLTKRKKGKKSKWGMPGAAQMEKIYRLKLCAKHEYKLGKCLMKKNQSREVYTGSGLSKSLCSIN